MSYVGPILNAQSSLRLNTRYFASRLLNCPSTDPLTLTQVKTHLKILLADTSQDTYLTSLIKSVVMYAEAFTKRDFITKKYITYRDIFYSPIQINRIKLQKVASIQYLLDAVLTTWAASNYYFTDDPNYYANILIKSDGEFPAEVDTQLQAIHIKYHAGIGIEVDTAERVATTVTITTVDDHGFSTGNYIIIANASIVDYNGRFQITVTGDKTFTYTAPSSGTDSATGDIISANKIPDDLTNAMLQHIARIYKNRGDCEGGNAAACDAGSAMNLPAETTMVYHRYQIMELSI